MDNIDGELQGVEETLAATRDFVDKKKKLFQRLWNGC